MLRCIASLSIELQSTAGLSYDFEMDVVCSADTARAIKLSASGPLASHTREAFVVVNSVCPSFVLPVTFKDDATIASFIHLVSDMPKFLSWFFHTGKNIFRHLSNDSE